MFKHLKYRAGAPLRYIYWTLAERTGWTLEYIESLPLGVLHEWMQIMDARGKAKE